MKTQLETWNNFVSKLLEAKEAWNKHRELVLASAPQGTLSSVLAMRVLAATFNRAEFDIALSRMVDYWRAYGGLEALYFGSGGSNFETASNDDENEDRKETQDVRRTKSRR